LDVRDKEVVLAKIQSILVDVLSVDEEALVPEASFINDLGADSLDLVDVIMKIEEELGVEIPDDEAEKLVTVAKMREYVLAKISESVAA
jgi:acyl carrier protein